MVWVRCPVWEGTEVAVVLARGVCGQGDRVVAGKMSSNIIQAVTTDSVVVPRCFEMTLIYPVRLSPPLPPHTLYTPNTECSVGPGPSSDSPGNELVLLFLRHVAHLRPQG